MREDEDDEGQDVVKEGADEREQKAEDEKESDVAEHCLACF